MYNFPWYSKSELQMVSFALDYKNVFCPYASSNQIRYVSQLIRLMPMHIWSVLRFSFFSFSRWKMFEIPRFPCSLMEAMRPSPALNALAARLLQPPSLETPSFTRPLPRNPPSQTLQHNGVWMRRLYILHLGKTKKKKKNIQKNPINNLHTPRRDKNSEKEQRSYIINNSE